jgi:hypothetical protein
MTKICVSSDGKYHLSIDSADFQKMIVKEVLNGLFLIWMTAMQDYLVLTQKAFLHFMLGEYEECLNVSLPIIEETFKQPFDRRV